MTVNEGKKMDMNYEEYTYEEEASLSADRDMFDEYRFSTDVENSLYEAKKVLIVAV